MVGAVGAGLQFLVFNFLRHHFPPVASNAVAIELAIISNFLLNNWLVFKTIKFNSKIRRFLKFNTCSLGSLLIQALWLFIGIKLLGRGLLIENALVFSGIFLGSISNYLLYSLVVWN